LKSNSFDDFVKDIESYYLNLKGEGIMLSPKEYDLIVNWRSRSVPKEIVIRGIRRAFEKGFIDDHDRKRNFRSLSQCAAYVEELIRGYKSSQQTGLSEARHGNKDMVQLTVERLNEIISSEKREFIRKHYIKSRKRILGLHGEGEGDVFNRLRQIEADFYEDVFQNMSGIDKKRLIEQAQAHLSTRERFMTKQARGESLISFRNELMIKQLRLANFNTMY
jgi:hypothetical protein